MTERDKIDKKENRLVTAVATNPIFFKLCRDYVARNNCGRYVVAMVEGYEEYLKND